MAVNTVFVEEGLVGYAYLEVRRAVADSLPLGRGRLIWDPETGLFWVNNGTIQNKNWNKVTSAASVNATTATEGVVKLTHNPPADWVGAPKVVSQWDPFWADVLPAHLASRANPHEVTATQVGAPTTAAFDSHLDDLENPHLVTHDQTAPVLYDPNSPDATEPRHLTDADAAAWNDHLYEIADPAGEDESNPTHVHEKWVKNWEAHRTATGNVHGATAAQVGAVPTGRLITPGEGLTGGGDLGEDVTLAMEEVGLNQGLLGPDVVTANFARVSVDPLGRVVALTEGTPSGTPPAETDVAGAVLVMADRPPLGATDRRGLVVTNPHPVAVTTDTDLTTLGAVPVDYELNVDASGPLAWTPAYDPATADTDPFFGNIERARTLGIKTGGITTALLQNGAVTHDKTAEDHNLVRVVDSLAARNALTALRRNMLVAVADEDVIYMFVGSGTGPSSASADWAALSGGGGGGAAASPDWKDSVKVATTGPLAAIASSSDGAGTWTASADGPAPATDGVPAALGQRVLVWQEVGTNRRRNGIYSYTDLGGPSSRWVLTRTPDANTASEFSTGMTVRVESGTLHGGYLFYLSTPDAPTVVTPGTTDMDFAKDREPEATETGVGTVRRATEAEVLAGTAGNIVPSVARLKTELGRRARVAYHFDAVRTGSDWELGAANASTKVVFNTENRDVGGWYNPATGLATVPVTGLYRVMGSVRFSTPSVDHNAHVGYAINGGAPVYLSVIRFESGLTLTAAFDIELELTAGQTVEIRAVTSLGSINAAFDPATRFQMRHIGPLA